MSVKQLLKRLMNNLFIYKKVLPVKIPVASQNDNFRGKCAIVSGGSSGIGFAIANKLVQNGCKVFILGRNETKLKNAAHEIGCEYRVADIANLDQSKDVITEIYATDKVDILVNSAGVNINEPFGSVTEKGWDACIDTNVKGTYFLTQSVTNEMKARKIKGHILNLSSASALRPCYSVYVISKHMIKDLTEGMAQALIPYGIVVNAIAPGPTATPMMQKNNNAEDLYFPNNPTERMASVEEIADLALYMLSDMGNYIVGSTFYISGGGGIIDRE